MTNAWASSPTPSLDVLSSEPPPSSALLVGWHLVWTFPVHLWDAYVFYLWYYQPNSWVGRLASTFRILAVVLILPVVLLTLLDVTSYVIARTLGVVDDVKASTSDTDATTTIKPERLDDARIDVAAVVPASARDVPNIFISDRSARASDGLLAPEDPVEGEMNGDGGDDRSASAVRDMSATLQPNMGGQGQMEMEARRQIEIERRTADDYFAGDVGLRLAGEGVFSPAASGPPSPLTPRIPLQALTENNERGSPQASEEGIVLRRRGHGTREDEPSHI